MGRLGHRNVAIYGTFNGNPLVMAAAKAMLTEVLTDEAHKTMAAQNKILGQRLRAACKGTGCEVVTVGGKGGFLFPSPARAREGVVMADPAAPELFWTFALNRGLYLAPAPDVRWTITTAHAEREIDLFSTVFSEFVELVNGCGPTPGRRR